MAILSNLFAEKDQKAIAPSTPSSGVFTAAGSTGAPAPNQAATPSSEPGKGTGFTNLEKYLQQNTGSQAGTIKAIGQQAGESQYESELAKTTGGYQQAAAQSEAATGKKAGEIAAGLKEKPMETVTQAGEFIGESYAGPTADPYQAQIKAAQQAQTGRLQTLGTAAGQQAALQEAFKGEAGYGKGFSALDQFLLAGNPQASGALQAQTKEQEARMKSAGEQAGKTLEQQQKAAQERFKKQQESVQKAAKERFTKTASDVDKALAKRMAEAEQRKQMGAQGLAMPSEGDVASEQQIAELEALSRIAGVPFDRTRYGQKTYAEGMIPERMVREETRGVMVPESQVVGYDSQGRPITEWERSNVLT